MAVELELAEMKKMIEDLKEKNEQQQRLLGEQRKSIEMLSEKRTYQGHGDR